MGLFMLNPKELVSRIWHFDKYVIYAQLVSSLHLIKVVVWGWGVLQ